GDMFGGDVAEIIVIPAFVLINAQAVVMQRRRGEGYIYFIYTNKLFAIIVCDHIHIIFCIFNFILENIVKPTKLRIYNCNILQVTLTPRFQIIDNIFHCGAINQRFSFVKLNILWKILRHKIHPFISHSLMQPNKILDCKPIFNCVKTSPYWPGGMKPKKFLLCHSFGFGIISWLSVNSLPGKFIYVAFNDSHSTVVIHKSTRIYNHVVH
ncbi:hypothetical protein AUM47_22185, partial [Cronobacter malonaticus]|nr:hypothetical protein [Cronobacter malonaticus]